MQIKLTWKKTNDILIFDVINQDLAEWFVQTSCRYGNQYSVGDQTIDVIKRPLESADLIQQEINYINTVNHHLRLLKMPEFELPNNWYDQQQLNKLHKDWAETRIKWPKLTELFYKINPELYVAYQEMNCHIHLIEESFCYGFRDPSNWRVSNPFKNNNYDWEICHLYLHYPGHGREAFEKFKSMDIYDDIDRDSVNWDNVDAFIGLNLVRPYKLVPPAEFLEWCNEKELTPHTNTIPLANISNWKENLTIARQLTAKNVKLQDNYFSLEITN